MDTRALLYISLRSQRNGGQHDVRNQRTPRFKYIDIMDEYLNIQLKVENPGVLSMEVYFIYTSRARGRVGPDGGLLRVCGCRCRVHTV